MNALEPLEFVLLDGRSGKFLLRHSALREVAKAMQLDRENIASAGLEMLSRVMYLSLEDRGEMTFGQFEELLPGDVELLGGFVEALRAQCCPENERYRPKKPNPAT